MASSLAPILQYVLPSIMDVPSNVTMKNNVNGTSAPSESSLGFLPSLLLSSSALREWLKLIVIGGVLETCRRSLFTSYNKFIDSFFITANFKEDDTSYGNLPLRPTCVRSSMLMLFSDWMMVWLAKNASWGENMYPSWSHLTVLISDYFIGSSSAKRSN